jgi:putative membrane-bound dehydrogenase-like protein
MMMRRISLSLILSTSLWTTPPVLAELHPVGKAAVQPGEKPAKAGPEGLLYKSHVVTEETIGHTVKFEVPLEPNIEKLYFIVSDGGNGFACDWADWVDARLTMTDGSEMKLTDLKWDSAASEWGTPQVGKNVGGQPMMVKGSAVADGIGTHANSVIIYSVPKGAVKLQGAGAIDDGGVKQGGGTSVQFQIWSKEPQLPKRGSRSGGALEPEAALAALDVAAGVEAATFAAEPMLYSPSSIDIDAKGRLWVAEIVNYRSHNGKRAEGDRILILEDIDKDGRADKQKVFYQGKDLISPHGVTVIDNGVLVSAGDKVVWLPDADGDDVADKMETVFSGISGTQHDHGIHAFHFGPDGKYYFNFGNAGNQLKDAAGNIVKDVAGNEVKCDGKPYRQGLVFRCDVDFKNVETLGWNFRNNWECNVDSYGTIWQSDNDDDGNKGVRINYVMEYGNYGYSDEMTGGGWEKGDAKTEEEVQVAHWHLKDPGVVPNLLQTGAGSPTGILFYEGNLLPAPFQHQMLHCDAGPNIVRAYVTQPSGAGYTAKVEDLLHGSRDRWFRPSDVCVAPDGSVIVADWYDPGVGGHAMGDLERGRLYRLAPPSHLTKYEAPVLELTSPEGRVKALCSPNEHCRLLAWKAIQAAPDATQAALEKLWQSGQPHEKARAMWALGKLTKAGAAAVQAAMVEKDPNLRVAGLRLARQLGLDLVATVKPLVKDPAAQVRRECALALRHTVSPEAAALWAELALQHDGSDKWYLAALHIGAQLHWDACLAAWETAVGEQWDTAGGRDIIWTSRAKQSSNWLSKVLTKSSISAEEKLRFARAFDFQKDKTGSQEAIKQVLGNL